MDNSRRRGGREDQGSEGFPMYSRLFVVCGKNVTEAHLQDAFSEFGTIESIFVPHHGGTAKGIAYIQYSKTSEAAKAIENLHLKRIPDSSKPLKVMIATNRSDIQSDEDDPQKYKRLFIQIPYGEGENGLDEHFSKFGAVESIDVQRDRNTGEPKGFAYVKYRKFSEAASAFESCDRKYRPIFAQPKKPNRPETSFESNLNSLANTSASIISMMNTRPGRSTCVNFLCAPYLNQRQIENIFDIVPGMVGCEYYIDQYRHCGRGSVKYTNPISASYAVEKLNEFEYPPGVPIFVKPDHSNFDKNHHNFPNIPNVVNKLTNAIKATNTTGGSDIARLAQAVAEASKIIKTVTGGVSDDTVPDSNQLNYCSVNLPPPKPLADIDAPVAKRCFLVCKPQPPPLKALRDVFCRFGNLISVYTLPNKTIGYACYATAESADNAMATVHGAEVCGVRMKVLEAEEESRPKRRRME